MAQRREQKSTKKPKTASECESISEPRKTVFLPPELKLAIVGCMGKQELKKVRLVSQEWSVFATTLLFDKVYISSRETDLTVFENITQHPVLGPVVREVIYDTSRFEHNISHQDYFDRLCHDLVECFVEENRDLEWPSDHLVSALKSEELEGVSSEDSRHELYKGHRNDDFVKEGYRRWRHYANSERYTAEQNSFTHTLIRGIQRSNGVRSFTVIGDFWETNLEETACHDRYRSGSPSIRCWNSLHARPRYDKDNEPSFVTFATAVVVLPSIKPVVSLSVFKGAVNCGTSLAPYALRKWSRCSIFTAFLDVCIYLESFSLTLETDETYDHAAPKALGVLPRILYRMKHLKRLDLTLSIESSPKSDTCNTYEQVFPQDGKWPSLLDLDLAGFAIGGYQLVSILSRRFPKLRRLCLSETKLVNGSWEAVIEGMCHTLQLDCLSLGYELEDLEQCCGTPFKTVKLDYPGEKDKLLHELEEYVISGDRHPCLSPNLPAEEALNFWSDICPLEKRKRASILSTVEYENAPLQSAIAAS